jgi:hypothetical protein
MKITNSLVKNYLVLFSRYHSDYYYFKHGMEYFMWNFYISSVKKGEGLLHAYISSLLIKGKAKTCDIPSACRKQTNFNPINQG